MTEHAFPAILQALRDHGLTVQEHGTTARCACPAHDGDGRDLNLSIFDTATRVNLKCHSHDCEPALVLEAIGLTVADRYDHDRRGEVTYDYLNIDGHRARTVHRKVGEKRFWQKIPDDQKGKPTPLYRLPQVAEAVAAGQTVWLVEGEEDVHALEAVGQVATTAPQGASNFAQADVKPLTGAHVVAVVDRDQAGDKWAAAVKASLAHVAASLEFRQAHEGKDVSDHLTAGLTLDQLDPYQPPEDTGQEQDEDDQTGPRLWNALDLTASAPLSWLARGRIPRAAVTILVGDEGIGKSLFWVWIAAAVTTGTALPEFGIPKREPGKVVLVLTEDEWASTVRPRLEVAGADLSRVAVICTEADGSGSPMFPRDLCLIAEAGADLIVVDAWLDTVPAGVKISDPHQARLMLHPWKEAATTTGSAVLLLTHTNRVDSRSARDRYGITVELRKKARQTLLAQVDEEERLTIGPEKSNLAKPIPASLFTIDAVQVFTPTDDSDGTVPRLRCVGESSRTAGGQLQANYDAAHEADDGDRTEAEMWLEDYLTANPGIESQEAKTVGAKKLKCSTKTIQRAAKHLRVVVESHGFPRVTTWTLPHSQDSQDTGNAYTSHYVPTVLTDDDKEKQYVPTDSQSGQSGQSGHVKTNGTTGDPTAVPPVGPADDLPAEWLMFSDQDICKECGNHLLGEHGMTKRCRDRHQAGGAA